MECPNCKEKIKECGCIRNKCIKCGKPVGNITFSVCDYCWDAEMPDEKLKSCWSCGSTTHRGKTYNIKDYVFCDSCIAMSSIANTLTKFKAQRKKRRHK